MDLELGLGYLYIYYVYYTRLDHMLYIMLQSTMCTTHFESYIHFGQTTKGWDLTEAIFFSATYLKTPTSDLTHSLLTTFKTSLKQI